MGSRKIVKYHADAIDSIRSDWHISDDGDDRGPIDQWPAPFLGSDDGSNQVPTRELRRAGSRSAMRFDESSGPIPPSVLPVRPGFDFDDGGLGYEGYDQGFARNAFAEERREDALFSRTGMGGPIGAYRFLRRLDPGSDISRAPRRGPHDVTSTSATMAGAGMLIGGGGARVVPGGAGFMMFSDAAGAGGDRLNPGEELIRGRELRSPNGAFRLVMQTDGNLVLYSGNQALWKSNTVSRGQKAVMQKDGNFVVYDGASRPAFNTGTQGKPGAFLALQSDGNLVIYHGQGVAWNAGTWGGVAARDQSEKSLLSKVGGAVLSVGEGIGQGVLAVGKTAVTLATSPMHLASDIASGRNVFESLKDTVKRDLASAKELAPYAQAVLSIVPGVGSGVNAAIAAGAALAQGQNITDALVAGVKGMVPGGPIAQQALETAYNVAKGQNITEAAVNAARSRIPPGPAQMAFDTGVALAKGQSIQQAAVQAGAKLLPGGVAQVAQKIASGENVIATLAGAAKEQGMSLVTDSVKRLSPVASQALSSTGPRIGQVVSSAVSIVPTNVKQTAAALLQRPELRALPISEIARRLNVPETDAREAVASVVQAANRAGQGMATRTLAPARQIAERLGTTTSFDQALSRFGSRMGPIVTSHNAVRALPRFPRLMPGGAMGLQDAGAFSTIKLGAKGDDVKAWQRVIGVTPDGAFGPQTDAATRAWQRAHGLTADGVVGPKTWAAAGTSTTPPVPSTAPTNAPGTITIPEVVVTATPPPPLTPGQKGAIQSMPTIRLGAQGAAVATWQGILRRDSGISGFSLAPDGQFGPITDTATRAWQRSSGLTPDGVVGPATWTKGIGSLTTPPLPGETAPGVPLPTPVPPALPPGLPPVPTTPVGGPPPIITMPPVVTPPSTPRPPVAPPPTQSDKAGGAVAALAVGALAAKLFGIF